MLKILLLILAFSVFSCEKTVQNIQTNPTAIEEQPEAKKLPKWFLNPPKDNQSKIYGVGSGYNVDNARSAALKYLSSKMITDISSEAESSKMESNSSYLDYYKMKSKEKTKEVRFTNYQITKSEEIDNVFYALVEVDRAQFLSDNKRLLEEKLAKMEKIYQKVSILRNKNSIIRKKALEDIGVIIVDSEHLMSLVKNLDDSFDIATYQKKFENYMDELDRVSDSLMVNLINNGVPNSIMDTLSKALTRANVKLAKTGNATIIEINSSITHSEIYGSNIAKISITANVREDGVTLKTSNFDVSGQSVSSKEMAVKAASEELQKKIDEKGILTILGI